MIKRIAIFTVLALVVAIGVFATVNPTHAQEVEVEESPAVQVTAQEEAEFEYTYDYQYGEGNGDVDSVMTQTRNRTQLRELQDGECVGDGEQQQIRQQLHINENQGEMRQQHLNQGDGTCNGDCVPLRQGGQGK